MLQVIVGNQTVNFPEKQFSVTVGNLTQQTNYNIQVFGCKMISSLLITKGTFDFGWLNMPHRTQIWLLRPTQI